MEYNDNTQHANTDPQQLEASQSAEPTSVPPVLTAMIFNRLGIRSAFHHDEMSDDLVNSLNGSEGSIRAAALQTLGKRAEQGEQIPIAAVVSALRDPEWSVRAIAALTLRLGGDRVPIEPLLDALRDEDESVRAAAARALGAMGARVPLQVLEAALHDPAWRVREATVLALGELGKRVPEEVLSGATNDSDEAVREAAGIALRQTYSDTVTMTNQDGKKNLSASVQNRQQGVKIKAGGKQQQPIFVKRGLSRRVVAVTVALVAIAFIVGGGITWSFHFYNPGSRKKAQLTPITITSKQLSFYGPGYSVLDNKGNLYVIDTDLQQTHTRVLKFSPSGDLLNEWHHFNIDAQPLYIVVDAQGNIYATAQGTNSIYRLSVTGELLQKWQVVGSHPVGLALDKQDNLYVAVFGGNTVQKFSPTGKPLAIWGTLGSEPGQFDHPVGVAIDGQGNIYVSDQGNDRIQKLAPTGKPVAQWGSAGLGPGQFLQPGSIAVDRYDNVYVTDGSSGLVQQFTSTGKPLAAWGATGGAGTVQFGIPRGVAVDAKGNIYVASVDSNGAMFINGRITILSPTGKILDVWR
jgi:sugar lactone lactonase YvrE